MQIGQFWKERTMELFVKVAILLCAALVFIAVSMDGGHAANGAAAVRSGCWPRLRLKFGKLCSAGLAEQFERIFLHRKHPLSQIFLGDIRREIDFEYALYRKRR